jgi:hypothetical protein
MMDDPLGLRKNQAPISSEDDPLGLRGNVSTLQTPSGPQRSGLEKFFINYPRSFLNDVLIPLGKAVTEPSPFQRDPLNPEKKPIPLGEGLKAIGRDYWKSYVEEPGTTLTEHPARVTNDLATLLFPAAKLAQLGGATRAATALSTTADVLNPIGQAGLIAKGARKAISNTGIPESLFARSMKIPPGSLRQEGREQVINRMVREENLPLGKDTLSTMNKNIAGLDRDIAQTLDDLSQPSVGGMHQRAVSSLDFNDVSNALDRLKAKYKGRSNPKEIYDMIDEVKDQYLQHGFNNGGQISLADANRLKKGIYEEIQSYYNQRQKPETGRIGIKTKEEAQARAEVASTLRDGILSHPDVPPTLRANLEREAGLMNSRKWVERALNRGQNLDPVSLSGIAFGMLVGQYHVPAAIAYRLTTAQAVQSRIALGLKHGSESLRNVGSVVKPGVVYGSQVGRIQGNQEPQMERLGDRPPLSAFER